MSHISPNLKYVTFFPGSLTATLCVDSEKLNLKYSRSVAQILSLSQKMEFHLTIIGSETGKKISKHLESLDPIIKEEKYSQIQELCVSFKPSVKYKDEYYFIKKEYPSEDKNTAPEIRKSIIQIATIEGLEEFYKQLHKIVGIEFTIPFPHVTLHTTSTLKENTLRGIGIYSEEEFRHMNPRKLDDDFLKNRN